MCLDVLDIYVFYIYVTDMHRGKHPHRGPRKARGRRMNADGAWEVKPPVTPLIEPALLLALRDGNTHGYELADQVGEFLGVSRIDHGNLYRGLRRLEEEEIVTSTWNDEEPGRSKRTYALTDSGEDLLDAWAKSLRFTRERLGAFLDGYERTS